MQAGIFIGCNRPDAPDRFLKRSDAVLLQDVRVTGRQTGGLVQALHLSDDMDPAGLIQV